MAMTENERKSRQEEQLATDFGTVGEAGLRERFTRTREVRKPQGKGEQTVQQVTSVSKKDRRRIRAAGEEFRSRGGAAGDAEAQSRGASGGGIVSTGDFGPGAIRLNTVTPVNSKINGR